MADAAAYLRLAQTGYGITPPDVGKVFSDAGKGYSLARDIDNRQTLADVGRYAAAGDMTGAKRTAFERGNVALGMEMDKDQRAQVAEAMSRLKEIGATAESQTDDQWEQTVGMYRQRGLNVPAEYNGPGGRQLAIAQSRTTLDRLKQDLLRAQTSSTKASADASRANAAATRAAVKNQSPEQRAALAQQYGLIPGTSEYRAFVLTGKLATTQVENASPEARAALAERYGLIPGTSEYRAFVLTGKLATKPAGSFREVKDGDRLYYLDPNTGTARVVAGVTQSPSAASNISSGLSEAATIPRRYDSFDNATGEWRAGDTFILSPLARAWGSVTSGLEQTRSAPGEVRRVIAGQTEALAAAIKPLIRKPGEGAWTDADQARLVAVVGDLGMANSQAQYYRALQDVKRRIESNFGLKLPPIQNIPPQFREQAPPAATQPTQPARSGTAPVRVNTAEEAMGLPPGTVFMTPDGRLKVRP